MGSISSQVSAQTALNGRPSAEGLLPRMGRKASLWRVISSGPQAMAWGKREPSISATVVFSASGQASTGPSGDPCQSWRRMASPIALPASRKRVCSDGIADVVEGPVRRGSSTASNLS